MARHVDRMRDFAGKVAVVGVGGTNFGADYRNNGATRRRGTPSEKDAYTYAAEAFAMALAESGLKKSDIDGVIVDGGLKNEVTCELFGLTPTWGSMQSGLADAMIPVAVMAIMSGQCDTVALIKGTSQRAENEQWGGQAAGRGRLGEYYFYPWGYNSPGAQHAMMWQHYMDVYGRKEEELFRVPLNARRHAMINPNAVFQSELTFENWWNSRYIAAPLRLFDYTMINDGGSCFILRRADMVSGLPQHPVLVNGFSWATAPHSSGLMDRVGDNYYGLTKEAADAAYAMAEIGPKDVDQFQVYDAFSDILVWGLEACGFAKRGEALDFIGADAANIWNDGDLPCMTSGGHQSEAYLQGWTQLVEAVRQVRHDYGDTARQVKDCNQSFYIHPGGEGPHTVLFKRA